MRSKAILTLIILIFTLQQNYLFGQTKIDIEKTAIRTFTTKVPYPEVQIIHGDDKYIYIAECSKDKSAGLNYAISSLNILKYDLNGRLIKSNQINLTKQEVKHWYMNSFSFNEKIYFTLSKKNDKFALFDISVREFDTANLTLKEKVIDIGQHESAAHIYVNSSENNLVFRTNQKVKSALSNSTGKSYKIYNKTLDLVNTHHLKDESLYGIYFVVSNKGTIYTYEQNKIKGTKSLLTKAVAFSIDGQQNSFQILKDINLEGENSFQYFFNNESELVVVGQYEYKEGKKSKCGLILEKYGINNVSNFTYSRNIDNENCPLSDNNSNILSMTKYSHSNPFENLLTKDYIDFLANLGVENKYYSFEKLFNYSRSDGGYSTGHIVNRSLTDKVKFKTPSMTFIPYSRFYHKSYSLFLLKHYSSTKSYTTFKYNLAILNYPSGE